MKPIQPGLAKELRDRIANVIAAYSANDVPSVCRRYGLAHGQRDEAFSSKFKYVSKRLFELPNETVIEKAWKVAQEEGDEELLRLLATVEPKTATPARRGFQPSRRAYYAERRGRGPAGGRLDLDGLKTLFRSEYERWDEEGYFQQHFGLYCVDAGRVPGSLGGDIDAKMLFDLGKAGLWPIAANMSYYDEDDLFSVIEFLFDHISKPLRGTMHQYAQCGMHWEKFDPSTGRAEFREGVNVLLARYGQGYELSEQGEVMELGPEGTANLLTTDLPIEESGIKGRVASAVTKFRQRHATADDRRDAVRDLADVLEYLRPQVKSVLTRKDEAALFTIANEFGIRHHNANQQTDYDPAIWMSWMFYFYLATIHACVRLIQKASA